MHGGGSVVGLGVTALLFLCAVPPSSTQSPLYPYVPYPSDLEGQVCGPPPNGYLPLPCGSRIIVGVVEEPLSPDDNGPNVCNVITTALVNETVYMYQKWCTYVYDYGSMSYAPLCTLQCLPTRACSNNLRSDIAKAVQCCAGFETRPSQDPDYQTYLYSLYYTPASQKPVGCPIADGCTVYDCLKRQNLTEFLRLVNLSDSASLGPNATTLFRLLNSTNSNITVFAPSNKALASTLQGLVVDPVMAGNIVRNHLVVGDVEDTQLGNQGQFMTVGGATLYSTTVVYYNFNPAYSQYTYPGYYNNAQMTTDRFINGAQVVVKDACYLRIDACPGYPYLAGTRQSGQLQIIDSVMMPANATIAEIISTDPRFSTLSEALDNLGILQFLNQSYPRTLFAPTDDALTAQLGLRLINCLTLYARRPLDNLILFNLAEGVEYTSSLSRRSYLNTLLLSYINVYAFSNGIILLGGNKVQIIQANIPASNGVIHVVNGWAIPPSFNFGKCQELVPTMPPPTPARPVPTASLKILPTTMTSMAAPSPING